MANKSEKFDYDVALSFAGEDREYVEAVAIELQNNNIKVFYDKFEVAALWGKNLYSYLSEIYTQKAQYCIIFVSSHYGQKQWTNLERESAQERAFNESREYILPVRFDQTKLPGLKETDGYLDAKQYSPVELCQVLMEKLNKQKTSNKKAAILKFLNNTQVDGNTLFNSIEVFKLWDSSNIRNQLPVTIYFPFNVQQRIDSYQQILESIQASAEISAESIQHAQKAYSQAYLKENFYDKITAVIRDLYNLHLDANISAAQFKNLVNIYASSQVINYIRNILAYRIVGTEDEDWLIDYYHLAGEYAPNLMSGLPYVMNQLAEHQVDFWVQIDLFDRASYIYNPTHIRKRLYLPNHLAMTIYKNDNLAEIKEELIQYLLPQLFEYNFAAQECFNISKFIHHIQEYEINIRAEWFYRTDNFKKIGQGYEIEQLKNEFIEKAKQNGMDEATLLSYQLLIFKD